MYGLETAIFDFTLKVSRTVGLLPLGPKSNELLDLQNIDLAFWNAFVSSLEAKDRYTHFRFGDRQFRFHTSGLVSQYWHYM